MINLDDELSGLLAAPRQYVCNGCGSRYPVGQCGQWATVALLKQARRAQCGADRFRPLQLVKEGRAA